MALIQSLLHSESRALQPSAEQQETEAADPQQAEGLSAVQVATVDSFQVPFHDSIPYREGLLNDCCCSLGFVLHT